MQSDAFRAAPCNDNTPSARSIAAQNRVSNPCTGCQKLRKKCSHETPCASCQGRGGECVREGRRSRRVGTEAGTPNRVIERRETTAGQSESPSTAPIIEAQETSPTSITPAEWNNLTYPSQVNASISTSQPDMCNAMHYSQYVSAMPYPPFAPVESNYPQTDQMTHHSLFDVSGSGWNLWPLNPLNTDADLPAITIAGTGDVWQQVLSGPEVDQNYNAFPQIPPVIAETYPSHHMGIGQTPYALAGMIQNTEVSPNNVNPAIPPSLISGGAGLGQQVDSATSIASTVPSTSHSITSGADGGYPQTQASLFHSMTDTPQNHQFDAEGSENSQTQTEHEDQANAGSFPAAGTGQIDPRLFGFF